VGERESVRVRETVCVGERDLHEAGQPALPVLQTILVQEHLRIASRDQGEFHRVEYFWKIRSLNENYYTCETAGHVPEQTCGNFRCKSDRRSPKSYFWEILAAMILLPEIRVCGQALPELSADSPCTDCRLEHLNNLLEAASQAQLEQTVGPAHDF